MFKRGLYLSLLTLTFLVGCHNQPDTLKDTGVPPTPDLPPIEIVSTDAPRAVLKEELFWQWKITALNEWEDGGDIWFTDGDGRNTMFYFKCNEMTLAGEMTNEGVWRATEERYGTTEAFCAGERGEQDRALLSLMLGPSNIERIGTGANTIRFSNSDHEMTLERQWLEGAKIDLPQEELIGNWDVIRFDDYMPKSRLNRDGNRSAYVDLYENMQIPNALTTNLNIGCNHSENSVRLNLQDKVYQLSNILQRYGRITTQMGCSPVRQKRDESFFSFMEQSPKIERLGEHRLRIWSDAHELILEKAATHQSRNSIRDFKALHGTWSITMVSKAGLGLGGKYFAPDPIIISEDKIQYGDLSPHLKKPGIRASKIIGKVVGNFEERDCSLSQAFSFENPSSENTPIATEENAICFVLYTLLGEHIAEPINLPVLLKLTSGDYELTLKRLKE